MLGALDPKEKVGEAFTSIDCDADQTSGYDTDRSDDGRFCGRKITKKKSSDSIEIIPATLAVLGFLIAFGSILIPSTHGYQGCLSGKEIAEGVALGAGMVIASVYASIFQEATGLSFKVEI